MLDPRVFSFIKFLTLVPSPARCMNTLIAHCFGIVTCIRR